MTITTKRRQAFERFGEVRIEDPDTHAEYVLVKAETYDRIKALVDETRGANPLALIAIANQLHSLAPEWPAEQ